MKVLSGTQAYRHFLMIHGAPGIGKTTFLANAPNVVFVQSENGTKRMNVARYQFDDNRGSPGARRQGVDGRVRKPTDAAPETGDPAPATGRLIFPLPGPPPLP